VQLRRLILCLVVAAVLAGARAGAAVRIRLVRLAGTPHVVLRDAAAYYGMAMRTEDDAVRLVSAHADVDFTRQDRRATINGVNVSLSHPLTAWTGEPMLSLVDLRVLLDPILRSASLPARPVGRIVLDPGHGGSDTGALGSRAREKDVTLAVAHNVRTLLQRVGYSVALTRAGDEKVSLRERVSRARHNGADLFVSIHANAAQDAGAAGIETFLLTPEGTRSTYSETVKTRPTPGNTFDRDNARLGFEIQRYLLRATGGTDRGLKHADFAVLRDAPCPAALVEIGFITNGPEEARLSDARHQRRIALGIARGIVAYHRAVAPAAR
jgi:N-acetylmuramoyl-L-alanine amidase